MYFNHNCGMEKDIIELKTTVNEIKRALIGDKFMPIGLVQRVEELENQSERLIKALEKIKYVALGYALGGAGIGALIVKIITTL